MLNFPIILPDYSEMERAVSAIQQRKDPDPRGWAMFGSYDGWRKELSLGWDSKYVRGLLPLMPPWVARTALLARLWASNVLSQQDVQLTWSCEVVMVRVSQRKH
jgi:hypothetical protein